MLVLVYQYGTGATRESKIKIVTTITQNLIESGTAVQ